MRSNLLSSWRGWRRRRDALARIRAVGGRSYYRDEGHERFVIRALTLPRLFRDRLLRRPTSFSFTGKLSDTDLQPLVELDQARSLVLFNTQHSDVALEYVAKLSRLEGLVMYGKSSVTDRGIQSLRSLGRLAWFGCDDAAITSAGFDDAAWMPELVSFQVNNTQVDDRIWAHLQRCSQLYELSLGDSLVRTIAPVARHVSLVDLCLNGLPIGDDEVRQLTALTQLQSLRLNDVPISDAALAYLAELTSLRDLAIGMTRIGDEGVQHLLQLPWLEELFLYETHISDDAIELLQAAPSLKFLALNGARLTPRAIHSLRDYEKLESVMLDQALFDAASEEDRAAVKCRLIPC